VIVTLTLNPSLDLTYALAETRVGEVDVHRATSATMEASGKGVNVSRALHANGVRTVAVLPLGGSTGHHLSELLVVEQVAHRCVEQPADTRINTTITLAGGETAKVNGPGGHLSATAIDSLKSEVAVALRGGAEGEDVWLAVCGSLPPGVDAALVGEFVALAHAEGARCAVDASGDALGAAISAGAELLAPNRIELAEVAPSAASASSVVELAATAAELAKRTRTSLLVSLGADGALFTDGDVMLHGHGPALVPVNTAGAGDALLSGWLAGAGTTTDRLSRAIRWSRAACLAPTTVAPPLAGAGQTGEISVDIISHTNTQGSRT
jgi:1-phosphofructokinase